MKDYGSAAKATYHVLTDPALPEVSRLVIELHELEKDGNDSRGQNGVGLQKIVLPLKAYVAYRKNSVTGSLGLVPLFAIPFAITFLLGYFLGKRKIAI